MERASERLFDADAENGSTPRGSAGRLILLIALIAGSGMLVVAVCVGLAVAGYLLLFSAPPIVGQWLVLQPPLGARVTIDFRKDGTGSIQGHGEDIAFNYTVSRDDPPILEWRVTSVARGGNAPVLKKPGKMAIAPHGDLKITVNNVLLIGAVVERFRVTLINDSLSLANENGAAPFTLSRVR
jgi:hypothetical protein